MIDLISIHIPKTAGTSFYQVLEREYDNKVSISIKRKHLVNDKNPLKNVILPHTKIIHGHFLYSEVKSIHDRDNSDIIVWLRDPVARVVSNYNFFISGLNNKKRNLKNYFINKHRKNETLLEYASKEENRNRMTKFLEGIDLEDIFFIGLVEYFNEDLDALASKLNWSLVNVPYLNKGTNASANYNENVLQQLQAWNSKDIELYKKALQIRGI